MLMSGGRPATAAATNDDPLAGDVQSREDRHPERLDLDRAAETFTQRRRQAGPQASPASVRGSEKNNTARIAAEAISPLVKPRGARIGGLLSGFLVAAAARTIGRVLVPHRQVPKLPAGAKKTPPNSPNLFRAVRPVARAYPLPVSSPLCFAVRQSWERTDHDSEG